MKNTKGISSILVGLIIAALAVGGFVLYKAGQESIPEIIFENDGPELVDHSENFVEPDLVEPYNPLTQESEGCLVVDNISAGDTVTFPLEITGTINNIGCWGMFEGEAGFAHIEQEGQVIVHGGQPTDRIIHPSGNWYISSEYPISFTATIPSIAGNVSGPANLVLTERASQADPEEIGGIEIIDQVTIPINLEENYSVAELHPEDYDYVGLSAISVWPGVLSFEQGLYSCNPGSGGELTVVEERVINGFTYCVEVFTTSATGQSYPEYTYKKTFGDAIAVVEFSFAVSHCGVYQGNGTSQYADCQASQAGFFSQLDDYADSLIN